MLTIIFNELVSEKRCIIMAWGVIYDDNSTAQAIHPNTCNLDSINPFILRRENFKI